jgi:hypothetical protein
MRVLKIVLLVIGCIVIFMIIASGIFWLLKRQRVIDPLEFNSPELTRKVLIASQGSDFKGAVVESLTTLLKERPVYLRVIDVTTLADVDESEWNAVVIIHTTERGRLQPDVKGYLDRVENLGKVVLVTTSGSGEWRTADYDIDVITSASRDSEIPSVLHSIASQLDAIFEE